MDTMVIDRTAWQEVQCLRTVAHALRMRAIGYSREAARLEDQLKQISYDTFDPPVMDLGNGELLVGATCAIGG